MATKVPTGVQISTGQGFGLGDRGAGQQLAPSAIRNVSPGRDPGENVSADAFGAPQGAALQNAAGALSHLASTAKQLDDNRKGADDAVTANAYKFRYNTALAQAYEDEKVGPSRGTADFYEGLDQKMARISQETQKQLESEGYRFSEDGKTKIDQIEYGLREKYGVSAITFENNARVEKLQNDFNEQVQVIEESVFATGETDDAYQAIDDTLGAFNGIVHKDGIDQLRQTARSRVAIAEWRRLAETDPKTAKKALGVGSNGTDSYFDAIKNAESGGNPSAKNPKSSATGLYQFTTGTWSAVSKAHPELGLTSDGRTDPAQQEKAIRAFTADNAASLNADGIVTTNGNLYAAHFLGVGGAKQVLSGEDGAKVSDIVSPGVISANPFLRGMTVADFKAWSDRKAGGGNFVPDERFSEIGYEDRLKLDGQADQQIQKITIQTNDAYRLQIATDPLSIDRQTILEDPRIDDGDKATLISSLNAATKQQRDQQGAVNWVGTRGNPYDGDDKKRADMAYTALTSGEDANPQAVGEYITEKSGVVPKSYVNELRNGLNSASAADVAQSAALGLSIVPIVSTGLERC